jgi:excisionase family DNA binding protein
MMADCDGLARDALYTTAQVAERLQLPVQTIRGAIRRGKLHAFLPAGRRHGYRIAESAIQEFLRASATPRAQEAPDAA